MTIPAPTQPVYRRRQKQQDYVVFGPADLIHEGEVTVHLKSGATKTETVKGVGAIFYVAETACRYGYLTENTRAVSVKASTTPAIQGDVEPALAMPTGPVNLDADDFMPDDGTDGGAEYFEASEAA
ncbi:hypothetical protein [Specibacter sp. RAF43]|uniref:hypothetical protein n=1 Tax=Specibacter sp. RAF43 TaxID=3233057 RepID=UPI003F9938CC